MIRAFWCWLFLVGALLGVAGVIGAAEEHPLVVWSGGPTPPLALKDLDGRPHELTDYRGKVVVVNFWATWCQPCREELPSLERLRDALRGRPFEVLAVNVNEGESRVNRFLAEVPLRFPVLLDRNGDAQRAWRVRGLPATFLLDPEVLIRYWYLGELDWARAEIVVTIESLLASAERSAPRSEAPARNGRGNIGHPPGGKPLSKN